MRVIANVLNMYLVESYLCEREIFGLTYVVDFIFGIICIDILRYQILMKGFKITNFVLPI